MNEKKPIYSKVEHPDREGTPLYFISVDEGWRSSILCERMYGWAADWLVEQLQGKPFAPITGHESRAHLYGRGEPQVSDDKIEHQWEEYVGRNGWVAHQRHCAVCELYEGDYSRSIPCEGKPHVCSVESGCFRPTPEGDDKP